MWKIKIMRRKRKRKKKKWVPLWWRELNSYMMRRWDTTSCLSEETMPYRNSAFLTNLECPFTYGKGGGHAQYNHNNNNNNTNNSNSSDNGDYVESAEAAYGGFAPMRRSVSCTSCLLCGSSARAREIDDVIGVSVGGVGMKKVASCSMCNWDVDDSIKSSDDGESNNRVTSDEQEEDDIEEDDDTTFSSAETDETSFDSSCDKLLKHLDRTLENDVPDACSGCIADEKVEQYTLLRHENYYTTQFIEPDDEIDTTPLHLLHDRYIDTSLSRTSPDGGECDDLMSDYEENRHDVFTSNDGKTCRLSDYNTDTDNDDLKQELHRTPTPNHKSGVTTKKQAKKHTKTKNCISLDKIASEELDEIFGRIQRRNSTVYESDADSEHNFIFRPLPKTKKTRRKSKMKKFRSVEDLCSKECVLPFGVLSRSQSSLELSKLIEITGSESTKELIAMDENGLHERWMEYLHTIGGLKAFVGNQSLRYIWQQIMLFHEDLQQPLEEFLKMNLEKFKNFYSTYQELEEVLQQKTEQQEKDTAKIYKDFEQTLNREKDQLQKTFVEKEEAWRKEMHKGLHSKQQEIESLDHVNSQLNERIKQLETVNKELKINKEKIESQFSHLNTTHGLVSRDNVELTEINNALMEKINLYDIVLKEQEEHTCNVNRQYETMKEKYRESKHQAHGLTEENEFLKLQITNLTTEVDDLKARNKLLHEQNSYPGNYSNPALYLSTSGDHGNDCFYENSFNDELNDTVPDRLNSPFNMRHSSFDGTFNNSNKHSNSLLQEVSLVESSPIKSPNMNFNKSLLTVPPSPTVSARRKMNRSRNTDSRNTAPTAPSKIRLASNKQTDFKVIFTGDANVGKTSLIRRICHGKFRQSREVTFEPDCSTKELEFNNQKLTLKLWDTLGQERFNSIPPSYFRKSDAVILMYDIAEEGSFINAKTWIRTIHDYTNENIFILLVASKSDLHHKRMVSSAKGQELATNNDAMYVETSAKTGENIQKLCQMIASTLLSREETVFIRNDFDTSLCSLSYSMSHHNSRNRSTNCCA